jgi:hypothetical protein
MSEQKEAGAKRYITKPIAIMATVGVLVASISALNAFTGLNFRPAWGYEIEQSIIFDEQTQIQLDKIFEVLDSTNRTILELQKGQYELQIGMIDRQKWELRNELAGHKAQQKGYTRNAATVPAWLQHLVDDTAVSIRKLDEARSRIERKLQEHISLLDTPTT